ncbi:MAG: hypothetical protein VYB16_01270 [Gemmatimonadota bacterium]|nr:hypothetical protein [Gemmatimonadota bacterium]
MGIGALRAEGCVARVRVGVERVTTPELDRAVDRGAALEGVGARDVVLADTRGAVLPGALEDRPGLTVEVCVRRGVVLLVASLRGVEVTTRRTPSVGRVSVAR